jgi:hypothetical protein
MSVISAFMRLKKEDGEFKSSLTNRRRGPGTREKFRSRRINLEGNTHA